MTQLTHIGWAYGPADIALVRCAFDAADVPVFFQGGAVHETMGHQAVAMGGARVTVFRHDEGAARALLSTCRLNHPQQFRGGFAVFLLSLSVLFGAVPVPFRAIYLRDEVGVIEGD